MSEVKMPPRPVVSVRRNIEQICHCAREALSVLENHEPEQPAIDDLVHARMLIDEVLPRLWGVERAAKAKTDGAETKKCGHAYGGRVCTMSAGHNGEWHDDGRACWPTEFKG
jgi:hypothetical protein